MNVCTSCEASGAISELAALADPLAGGQQILRFHS